MTIFNFDESYLIGRVREVDTRKVSILVKKDEDLRKAHVSQLAAMPLPGATEFWVLGIIERVIKTVAMPTDDKTGKSTQGSNDNQGEQVVNTVRLTLVGTVQWDAAKQKYKFSPSITQVPEIDSECHVLRDAQLESFMSILSAEGDKKHTLKLGTYTINESTKAYLDGNKFFQRHAALLGSTGSGKSWTVATILEQAAKLSSANLIVFDLHGEYGELSYARHLRVPGPDELGTVSDEMLYLPYWLLNAEEMQAMFIDRSEFSAHNQVMAFQDAVVEQKKATLTDLGKDKVLNAFTLDSPVPFSLDKVIGKLKSLNEKMVEGA